METMLVARHADFNCHHGPDLQPYTADPSRPHRRFDPQESYYNRVKQQATAFRRLDNRFHLARIQNMYFKANSNCRLSTEVLVIAAAPGKSTAI